LRLAMNRFAVFLRWFSGFVLRLISRVEIEGIEHFPRRGPIIVVVNHLHWLDVPLSVAVVPRVPGPETLMAAEKWHKGIPGWILEKAGVVFVRRGKPDRKALRRSMEVLEAGGLLGVAPEGTRSRSGKLQRGKAGTAYIAYKTGSPIIPVGIWGQEKVFPALRRLRRETIHVRFGQVFTLPRVPGKVSSRDLDAYADMIMERIAELLPPEYRGEYGGRLSS
jgi:1-acyl-sn-glycerol-3-phosphate acyltransferase